MNPSIISEIVGSDLDFQDKVYKTHHNMYTSAYYTYHAGSGGGPAQYPYVHNGPP
jgi:hypothetical protein